MIALGFMIMGLALMSIAPVFKGTDRMVCLCIATSMVCVLLGILAPLISG